MIATTTWLSSPGVRLVNIGLRALPLRHPWKQRRQRPFVGLLKLPQLQGRGTVPNTWAPATETALTEVIALFVSAMQAMR